jgi:tRNA(fMet)-specific endonuclease VapC
MSLSYLIDTDWVIDHFHSVEKVVEKLEELASDGLAVSIISLAELYEGIYYSTDP